MNRIPLGIFVFAAVVIFLAGCNSSSTPPAPVTLAVTPTSALVFSTQSIQLTAADSVGPTDVSWSVSAGSGATVDPTGNFTAPAVTQNTSITVTASSLKDPTKTSSTAITVLASGQVTATTNPQVAMYTLTPPSGLNVFIQFGTDTSYKLKTWTQPGPATGSLSFFVAGMLASTDYHMRAVVQSADGSVANDLDHLFTTSALTATGPAMTVTTSPGMTPQPGIEMLDLITGVAGVARLAAVDLSGNVIWTYSALGTGRTLEGVHLLPNGHFIICGFPDVVREIDLAGNTIRQESTTQLIASLTKAGITMAVRNFHHDVIQLPNGRLIALFQLSKLCSDIPSCPAPATTEILGDALAELIPQSDGTFQLGWVWNTFDHLDITRALMGYPDWTHSNAITYTDDGNLLLSIRHESWIIKIDYANGAGAGDILWRLGYQGDFTLVGGTEPTDWFYAQHDPNFATTNSSGKFQMALMDNGNLRVFPTGVTCGTTGQPPCNYSTVPLLELDETASPKTATIISDYKPREYSFWGGGAQQLGNGNIEGDFNAGAGGIFTDIFEVIPGSAPQTVWHLQTSNANAYRGFRMPSLYPGVQW